MNQPALLLLALGLCTAPSVRAQSTLELGQSGGGLGQTATFELEGDPNRPYLLWCDTVEVDRELAPGVFAHVGFNLIKVSLIVPGFLGTLSNSGTASVTVGIPNDPALADQVISFQSLYLDVIDATSNFTRLTPAAPGSFRETVTAPQLPLLSGLASNQPDGTVILLDTTLPLVHRYTPGTEEFEIIDLSCALGLLSTFNVLPDGRIFMSGGIDPGSGQPQTTCILFDPATQDCTEYAMATPRAGHAAAVTSRGEILLSGGFTNLDFTDIPALFSGISNTTELFDPATGAFRAGPDLLESKALHTATTTADGKVLVAGGLTLIPFVDLPFVSITGYLYDPGPDLFGLPLFFTEGRLMQGAALLDNKKVLLAGGVNVDFTDFLTSGNLADLKIVALTTGELWKDGFLGGSFTHVTGLAKGRSLPAVQALPGARALVAGGFDLFINGGDPTLWVFEPTATADLYFNNGFTATGDMVQARIAPITTFLPDGTVLVVGGAAVGAEIYQP